MNRKHSAGHDRGKAAEGHGLQTPARPTTEHVPNRTEQDLARERKKEVKIVEVEK